MSDLAPDQTEEKKTEDEIESGKTDEGEDDVTVTDDFAVAVAGVKEVVDQPGFGDRVRSSIQPSVLAM